MTPFEAFTTAVASAPDAESARGPGRPREIPEGEVRVYERPTTPGTGYYAPQKLNYTHDALIDAVLANPNLFQHQLGEMFGRSAQWVRYVMASDAFKARLEARKAEVVDPILATTNANRLEALAAASLEKLQAIVDDPTKIPSNDFLLQTAKLATSAMGYGARGPAGDGNKVNVAVVVQVPPKAASVAEWSSTYSPGASG